MKVFRSLGDGFEFPVVAVAGCADVPEADLGRLDGGEALQGLKLFSPGKLP